jgi:DNA-binding NtrC family response regulator
MANILAIDDEAVLLCLIATTLRRDGHDVTATDDPLAAIDSFIAGSLAVDLLLINVSMTPISGFETVKRLIKAGFDGPVLFTTGCSTLSGAVVNSLGERAVIEKPFTAPQLRAAIGRALARNRAKPPRAA